MSGAAPTIELLAGDQVLPVSSIGAAALSLGTRIGAGAERLDRFVLGIADGASRIRVPFRGRVAPDGAQIVVDESDRALVTAAALGQLDGLVTPYTAPGTHRRRSRYLPLVVLGCVVLGAYVGIRLWDKITTIEPRIAYLATEVTTLLSPTSGRVSFVEGVGAVEPGQPAVGLETTSGKSLLIDAPGNVDIVAAEKNVGDRVKRGDPLLAYALPNAPLYLHAVVDREQAFRLASGTPLRYERLDASSGSISLDVAAADLHVRALPPDAGHQLYDVRIPITSGEEHHRALPVRLRFEQDLTTSIAGVLRAIGLPSFAGMAP